MRKITFGQRLRYGFDNTMARGTPALIGWLAILSAIMILIIALIVLFLPANLGPATDNNQSLSFGELLWMSLLRTLDPGTMGGDQGGWPFLLSMLGVTVGGIFIVSTLIGVLTTGVDNKVQELRKGRSFVVESGHTLILGWSEQIFIVISELVVANANQRRSRIVILANKDKVEMEDAIRDKVGHTGKTRVVCRTGSPIDLVDLSIVNPQGARSIIVLAPEGEDPDSQVIKTVLAITNNPRRRPEPYHIVAEIHDHKNMEAARLVGGDEAQLVEVGDVISRVTVQTCRQSGLSVVYTELLDFEGDEIYFQEEPALVGKMFGEALSAYKDSTIIGLQSADGAVSMNPPMDRRIAPGDKLIAISEDDDTVKMSVGAEPQIDEEAIVDVAPTLYEPERTLLLGWNRRACNIICELNNYVAPGSTVAVLADYAGGEVEIARRCANLSNLTVTFSQGDTTDRSTLDALGIEGYQHVIVLCYSDVLDPQRADARTLVTLLHLRDIEAKAGDKFSIVSEMLDDRNRELAEVTKADDFIVSDKLISLMLAQISENKRLNAVFTDLFNPEGSEIYLKPASDYIAPGREVNFYNVVEAARRRGQVAIGYRLREYAGDASKAYGVVVNPDKSKPVTFSAADRVIVLAED